MRKVVLKSDLALGDGVLLTGAVRDLHRLHPGQFQTDVRTGFPDLWRHNPYLTPLREYDPDVKVVHCDLPLIQQSNDAGLHCLHGFLDDLSRHLGVALRLTAFKGDLHLARSERSSPCLAHRRVGARLPFWLVSSGGKIDLTAKWWDPQRYQEVVDYFRGRILFVQVGGLDDYHPRLEGVCDLRGQTTVRDLVRLVHHAQGVLCGVTGLMHLAAAVPPLTGRMGPRPCVVVAGGREPPSWEAYPGHQFLHTIGALACCSPNACWRSRTRPFNGHDASDKPDQLCLDVRGHLPRCMDMISSADVIRRIETYFEGGATTYLSTAERRSAARALARKPTSPATREPLTLNTAPAAASAFIHRLPAAPGHDLGRGIVICAGGVRMFTNAWVCLRMLRWLGCTLPVEFWHLGARELDDTMRALVEPLGVRCVDAKRATEPFPTPVPSPWVLKPFAVAHSRFREVLLLDADNVPVQNPEFLFESAPYRKTGAVFWPDYGRLGPERTAWQAFDVPFRDEPEFESGQLVVDKARCWRPLRLALWYNEQARFFYQHVLGDKETFHLAFRRLEVPFSMPARGIHTLPGVMCQHDFGGRRLFQHRNMAKWRLFGTNPRIRGFRYEAKCLDFLRDLGRQWCGRVTMRHAEPPAPSRSPRTPLPRLSRDVSLFACMTTCAERESTRRQTLANLARTDWGNRPVHLQLDVRRTDNRVENITHTAWLALQAALDSKADYVLYLEDDLDFNRHLTHNLFSWERVQNRQLTLATLYNSGFTEIGWDIPPRAFAFDSRNMMGAQALLMARSAVEFMLEHWFEGPSPVDLKVGSLAFRMGRPVLCHTPSLVEHVGKQSVWGGTYHSSRDFDPDWKAPGTRGLAHLRP